jgi:hypothetical protein
MSTSHPDENLLEIITAYVDGEATQSEILSIEKKQKSDEYIRKAIDSELQVKELLKQHCTRIKAPEDLRNRCLSLITNTSTNAQVVEATDAENVGTTSTTRLSNSPSPLFPVILKWAVAASIIFSLGYWLMLTTQQAPLTLATSYAVEDHAHRHFILAASDNMIESVHSTTEAEAYLLSHYGMDITVPELSGAQFDGIDVTEFVPGYKTPLLRYSATHEDDHIYIFAFSIDKMHGDVYLERDENAVSTCQSDKDVHIKDVAGKHVVSWKWGETWYVGISEHDGNVLASMLPTAN